MKTRLLFAAPFAAVGLALATILAPPTLHAEEKPQGPAAGRETPAKTAPYDIEIADGQLLLANLRNRINIHAKRGPGDLAAVDATLGNVVEVLRELHTNANITIAPGLEKVKIGDLKLRSSRLDGELQAIQLASGLKFDCVAARNSDAAHPSFLLGAQPAEQTRKAEVFNLSPYLQQFDEPDPQKVDDSIQRIRELILETYAELRPDNAEHPSFQFHPGANLLVVIGQPDALEVAQKCINALQQPIPGLPYGSTPSSAYGRPISKERRELMKKLETIRLDSIAYDSLPLSEVVRHLVDVSKKIDPEKRGLNFLLNPNAPLSPSATVMPAIDPTTGLPVPAEAVDINVVSVKIIPALVNVRLIDALDAIVKVADHPIRYSVTDYAIVFSLSAPGVAEDRPMPSGASAR